MKRGVVTYFDRRNGHGYLAIKGKKDALFYLNQRRGFERAEPRPEWSSSKILEHRDPEVGDMLAFELKPPSGRRRTTARWGFLEEYLRLEATSDVTVRVFA